MFKFMKSKKGFSLVELMIVVVIMAILVAVAVPIFNSVTGNAREKTCIDNQRQIMTAIGNLYMGEGVAGATGQSYEITITNGVMTVPADTALATFEGKTGNGATPDVSHDDIMGSFKTVPGCGDENNTITATVTANPGGTAVVSSTSCEDGTGAATGHNLATNDQADD